MKKVTGDHHYQDSSIIRIDNTLNFLINIAFLHNFSINLAVQKYRKSLSILRCGGGFSCEGELARTHCSTICRED